MKLGIYGVILTFGIFAIMAFTTEPNSSTSNIYSAMAQDSTDEDCPCEVEDSLSQEDLLCMNSAAKIYSCLNGVDVKPEEVFSCEWYLYTGEETILRRYDKDEMPLVIKNNIKYAKVLWIRGLRLQNEFGEPTDVYLRKRAKIRFAKRKVDPN
ncbi:MAG: hypothetical protein JXQ87_14390 [Bacteroidia bacterium]